MRQRVPWNVKGVRPEVRDTAREAARRAGIPVGQWLDQAIMEQAGGSSPHGYQQHPHYAPPQSHAPQPYAPYPPHPPAYAADQPPAYPVPPQLPAFAGPPPAPQWQAPAYPQPHYGHGAHPPAPTPQPAAPMPTPMPAPAARQPTYVPAPHFQPQPDWPSELDRAVAEISARQQALDIDPAAPPQQPMPRAETMPSPAYSPAAPQVTAPPAYTPPPAYAPPPPAAAPAFDFSTLERQLQGITAQIESLNRSDGGFSQAIAELRKDLTEIGRTLMEAMPRRALDALEADVRRLSEKIEQSRMAGVDPATIANMEKGLADVREALRTLTPAESLVGFEQAVRSLAAKVDQISTSHHDPATFQQLEATITALRGVVAHVASNETLLGLSEEVRGLAAKIDRVAGHSNGLGPEALSLLEKRIADLPILSAIERGFGELKAHILDLQRFDPAGALKQDFDRTRVSLDSLHGLLGQVITRLATIESGLQAAAARSEPQQPPVAPMATPAAPTSPSPSAGPAPFAAPPTASPSPFAAPAPSASPTPTAPPARVAVPETAAPAQTSPAQTKPPSPPPPAQAAPAASAAPAAPVASTAPAAAAPAPAATAAPQPRPRPRTVQDRQPINPNLPPDFPLEPGSGAPRMRPTPSAAERIAASEAALGPGLPGASETPPTNFIAAARRAAQAAAPAMSGDKADETNEKFGKTIGQRVRALIVGGSAAIAAIASLHVAMKMFDPANQGEIGVVLTDPPPGIEEKMLAEEAAREEKEAAEQANTASAPALVPPSGVLLPENKPAAPADLALAPVMHSGITGSVSRGAAPSQPAAAPSDERPQLPERLPEVLREAALNGEPGAEYEVAIRYLEGRGLPQNTAEGVRWLERAAAAGLAPAQFRLANLHEKGQGVKKNLEKARQLYVAAANKGNAKAMHNLAVLYAEGIDGKPDYKTAAIWFRKAAEHGTADSQHNLGILYARGVGVEQNLAESYKWFALAANQGDRDSASKRDDVAARLDQGSLMAAKLAVQSFVVKPQPDEAVNVKAPPGGWDPRPASSPRPEKKRKPGSPMRVTPS